MLIFLGGTVGHNPWRKKLIHDLGTDAALFDPVVEDWNEEAQEAEERAKREADLFVFYIANPKQEGISVSSYSLVEATMALYDAPESTVVAFDYNGYGPLHAHSVKALKQAEKVLRARFPEASIFSSYTELCDWLKLRLT